MKIENKSIVEEKIIEKQFVRFTKEDIQNMIIDRLDKEGIDTSGCTILFNTKFRYALGRKTSAPSIVVEAIQDNIDIFDIWEIEITIKEIDECRDYGMECDKIQWLGFMSWLAKRL